MTWSAIFYGIGLGLTFDEFGMWVHLGGSYWQNASVDAVMLIAAGLGMLAYAPSPKTFRTEHWGWTALMTLVVCGFIVVVYLATTNEVKKAMPWLQKIETAGPQ